MPAHPWTISAYLRWCERRHRSRNAAHSVKTIARAHLLNCLKSPDSHPTVLRTLRMIETRAGSESSRSDLFSPGDFLEKNAPEPSKGGPPKEEPSEKKVSRRHVRSMRSTPKLVSRRR